MSTTTVIALAVLVGVAVLALVLWAAVRRQRTAKLRDTFGSEYDRTVEGADKRREAERELADRKAMHDELELRPLAPASRQRYMTAWGALQTRFVDTPVLALHEADELVTALMAERGYPTEDFDTRARLLSVEHTEVLDGYRSAHSIASDSRQGSADTEQVRQAMLGFRSVFEDLLHDERDSTIDLDGRRGEEPYGAYEAVPNEDVVPSGRRRR